MLKHSNDNLALVEEILYLRQENEKLRAEIKQWIDLTMKGENLRTHAMLSVLCQIARPVKAEGSEHSR